MNCIVNSLDTKRIVYFAVFNKYKLYFATNVVDVCRVLHNVDPTFERRLQNNSDSLKQEQVKLVEAQSRRYMFNATC